MKYLHHHRSSEKENMIKIVTVLWKMVSAAVFTTFKVETIAKDLGIEVSRVL